MSTREVSFDEDEDSDDEDDVVSGDELHWDDDGDWDTAIERSHNPKDKVIELTAQQKAKLDLKLLTEDIGIPDDMEYLAADKKFLDMASEKKRVFAYFWRIEQSVVEINPRKIESGIREINGRADKENWTEFRRKKEIQAQVQKRINALDQIGNKAYDGMLASGASAMSVITLRMKTPNGDDVKAEIYNFAPYMYATIPTDVKYLNLPKLQSFFDELLDRDILKCPSLCKYRKPHILKLEVQSWKTADGYTGDNKIRVLKFSLSVSALIPRLRKLLYSDGFSCPSVFTEPGPSTLQLIKAPTKAGVNKLGTTLVEDKDNGLCLHCDYNTYRQLRLRFYISEKCVTKYINNQLSETHLYCRGWPLFLDKTISRTKNPAAALIPVGWRAGEKDVYPVGTRVYLQDPMVAVNHEDGMLVFKLSANLTNHLRKLEGWNNDEKKLLITRKLMGEDKLPFVKSSFLWDKDRHFGLFLDPDKAKSLRTKLLSSGNIALDLGTHLRVHECHIAFTYRFQSDKHINGCSYVSLSNYEYKFDGSTHMFKLDHKDIASTPDMEKVLGRPKIRVLSFDTEWIGHGGHFPDSKTDPMCGVGGMLSYLGDKVTPMIGWAGCLGKCAAPDAKANFTVHSWDYESSARKAIGIRALDKLYERWKDLIPLLKDFFEANTVKPEPSFSAIVDQYVLTDRRSPWEKLCDDIPAVINDMRISSDIQNHIDDHIAACLALLSSKEEHKLRSRFEEWVAEYRSLHILECVVKARIPFQRRMLYGWAQLVQKVRPDIIWGWNNKNFDIRYMLEQALAIGAPEAFILGRDNAVASFRETKYHTRGTGDQDRYLADFPGIIILDGYEIVRSDDKYPQNTLNYVGQAVLKQQKLDLHHSLIPDMAYGTPEQRLKLIEYMMRDCELPTLILEKREKVTNAIHLAKITGLPLNDIYERGQCPRTTRRFLEMMNTLGFLMPYSESALSREDITTADVNRRVRKEDGGDVKAANKSKAQYEGALVVEPKIGFYTRPVSTWDFNQLYPSLMQAYNTCYTTNIIVTDEEIKKWNPDDIYLEDVGLGMMACFVREHVFVGLLARLQKYFTEQRAQVKAALKKAENTRDALKRELEKDPQNKALKAQLVEAETLCANLDAHQKAIKTASNSCYGYPGAFGWRNISIPAMVTCKGRDSALLVQAELKKEFCKANGYKYDINIIYGDTDSVMAEFGETDLRECVLMSKKAEGVMKRVLKEPLFCEFEKIWELACLLQKKRYIAYKLISVKDFLAFGDDRCEIKCSGTENVRRDNCLFTTETMEEVLKLIMTRDMGPDPRPSKRREYVCNRATAKIQERSVDILNGHVSLGKLRFTTSIGKRNRTSKSPASVMCDILTKRDPRNAPRPGDRVKYTIINTGDLSKGMKIGSAVEDPQVALEQDLPIWYEKIWEKKFVKPMVRFMRWFVVPSTVQTVRGKEQLVLPINKKEKDKYLNKYIDPQVYYHLFGNIHQMRGIKVFHVPKLKSTNPVHKFVVKSYRCPGPKCRIPQDVPGFCPTCKENAAGLIKDLKALMKEKEQTIVQLWDKCRACDQLKVGVAKCRNGDCTTNVPRTESIKHLKECVENLRAVEAF